MNASSQTYSLDDGMVGRIPITFKEGSFVKIQDSTLLLQINVVAFQQSVSEYKIVQDETKKHDDREIRTLRLLSTSDENIRIHGTIVTGDSVRNTLSANYYDMTTQITTPYVIYIGDESYVRLQPVASEGF
ncbi:hypothetical protein QWY87_09530 [Lutimonas halocynthiae]|uniref:hypothetical protein n=1 Tax=Lutimonas halocynthiae TaxID=1446477 RepID=UPI0025B57D88|nr:hypothetical protein [Lutimonas halocynthiae]MDN3642940.1 hypothetical protein [Lutimonas halocynthiae]